GGQRACDVLWRMHVDGELDAVASSQILVAAGFDRLVVDIAAGRRRTRGQHGEGPGLGAPRVKANAVAASGSDVSEQQASQRVRQLGGDLPAAWADQVHARL